MRRSDGGFLFSGFEAESLPLLGSLIAPRCELRAAAFCPDSGQTVVGTADQRERGAHGREAGECVCVAQGPLEAHRWFKSSACKGMQQT